MACEKSLILDIKGNSLDDGPGIRSVIFFKGCPLSCVWCHNPESKRRTAELSFDVRECVACGSCIDVCPKGALSPMNPGLIDRSICHLCFNCLDECPSGALCRTGKEMSVTEVLKNVLKDKTFYDNSGGGVTLSGGEPTVWINFCVELLQALKQAGVHTLIETCGLFNLEMFKKTILPWTDMIYMDIKIMDPSAHNHFCGSDNGIILKNFTALNQLAREGSSAIIPRIPLIPGITATVDNINAIVDFLKKEGVSEARLLGYNPLWVDKNAMIGVENVYADDAAMTTWLPADKTRCLEEIFIQAGIDLGT